jgi:hypothetical protein
MGRKCSSELLVYLWLRTAWLDTTAAFLPMDRSLSNSFVIYLLPMGCFPALDFFQLFSDWKWENIYNAWRNK